MNLKQEFSLYERGKKYTIQFQHGWQENKTANANFRKPGICSPARTSWTELSSTGRLSALQKKNKFSKSRLNAGLGSR